MSEEKTTIQISLATKKLLLELMRPQESYDSVLYRILKDSQSKIRVVSKDSVLDALSKIIDDIRSLE